MPTGYRKAADLPQVIPVFPLDGALLLPGGQLPLNIFEPRYLNMIDDAMAADRMIGMVQTREGGDRLRPHLAPVGCLGKITSFAETGDGRYLITLTGICRFAVGDELPVQTPYRQVRARFEPYDGDLRPQDGEALADRRPFLVALRHYLDHRGLEIDWESAEAAPPDALINSLAMALPFEAASLSERRDALIALLEFDAAGGDDDEHSRLQ